MQAKALLARFNREYGQWANMQTHASWEYAVNLTDYNLQKMLNLSSTVADYTRQQWQEVNAFNWKDIKDFDTRRQFAKLATPGSAALDKEVS